MPSRTQRLFGVHRLHGCDFEICSARLKYHLHGRVAKFRILGMRASLTTRNGAFAILHESSPAMDASNLRTNTTGSTRGTNFLLGEKVPNPRFESDAVSSASLPASDRAPQPERWAAAETLMPAQLYR